MKYLFSGHPFGHVLLAPVLREHAIDRLLGELEGAEWQRRADTFYRFDVPSSPAPMQVEGFLEQSSSDLKLLLEASLGCALAAEPQFEIHRYRKNDGIGPHTDARCPEVRVVININSGWSSSQGGVWVLATESTMTSGRHLLPAICNTAFAFATSSRTFHALSVRRSGVSYGITIRFARLNLS